MPGSDTPVIAVESVTKRFDAVTALSDVAFEVHPGEGLPLLGPPLPEFRLPCRPPPQGMQMNAGPGQ